jgi:hypothetical protein
MFRVAVLAGEVSTSCIIKGEIHLASLHEASLNTSFGASKPIEAGMMVATCKKNLQKSTWSVSVPENTDLSTFASLGFDQSMIEEIKISLVFPIS